MDTHKSLFFSVKENETRLRDLELSFSKDQLYIQYQKQFDELNQKREKLRTEMSRLREEHLAKNRDEINFLKEEISYLKNLVFHADGLEPKNYSYDIQTMFKKFNSGTTTSPNMKRLVWVSDDERYIVLKIKGHGGGAYPNNWYLPVSFYLYSVEDVSLNRLQTALGSILSFEGRRWSRHMLKQFQVAIQKYECNLK